MHFKVGNKKTGSWGKMAVRSSFKNAINLFLVSIFLIQSFSGFTYLQNSSNNSGNTSANSNLFEFTVHSFYAPLNHPLKNAAWDLESECQVAEEDDIQEKSDESSIESYGNSRSEAAFLLYASLNIQYLKLNEFNHKHLNLPLFILHHNWKGFIS